MDGERSEKRWRISTRTSPDGGIVGGVGGGGWRLEVEGLFGG